ncbi:MAG: sugar phosphate isomerase/epimerase [Chloroflexi bacterium]|nr:sugar phosphate isomerase/epimerase [Chloroflexota bacterium]
MTRGTVGAQLYTAREYCKDIRGIAETAAKVARIGYTAVQISGIGPADPAEVGKVMADHGLTVAATHMGWPRFLNELDAVIEEHLLWKCAHPAIGSLPAEYFSADGVKRFCDELGPVLEKLAAAGMDFSYHNHNHEFAKHDGVRWIDALYANAPKALNFEIDTYWVQAGGADPVSWVAKCAGREPLLHLKDMTILPNREVRYAEIGEGNLNWEQILPAAHRSGVEYYLVEQDLTYERTPFESLEISYRNLVKMGLH